MNRITIGAKREIKMLFWQKNWRDYVLSKMNLQKITGCLIPRDDGYIYKYMLVTTWGETEGWECNKNKT